MWCGVIVVCFAVHLYTGASASPPQPTAPPSAVKASASAAEESASPASGKDAAAGCRGGVGQHAQQSHLSTEKEEDQENVSLIGKRADRRTAKGSQR
eukprot:CAMPEP_0170433836 /NCGR_PEP_ID=MMETSP0117_2-20130122/42718_1 /TAXON_ID=400756 /ORGANISM="Durinskia baltica, Strain CSIRO CS-38" /LENGTH=96 /DNA_ID=CAMNT_0010693627 /DNA_START=12 /DNA_END=298 /DNA_ORIENTATION=-